MIMPDAAASADLPTVYWMPHCSSCMAVKQFLDRHGVTYRSVNVLEDDTAMERLAALGIRSVPVVVRGDQFVFAQYLDDVAAFLRLDKAPPAPLDRMVLGARLVEILEIAAHVIAKLPESALTQRLPGRDRSYFVVAHHVFQIAAAARCGIAEGSLHDRDSLAEPPAEMVTRRDIEAFAQDVLADVRVWVGQLGVLRATDVINTDYGPRTLPDVLHRVVSHVAQHLRQLVTHSQKLGIGLERDMRSGLLDGLTLADDSLDRSTRS
jgi:glutaredoxin